jgi:hypothetical protein
VCDTIGAHQYVRELEEFYGFGQRSYNIILIPLYHRAGFGVKIPRKKGASNVFALCGSMAIEDGVPVLGPEPLVRHLVYHEFSHSFIDLRGEDVRKRIVEYSSLYGPIASRMRSLGYESWESCAEEHIVRAVTARLAGGARGEKELKNVLLMERSTGFFYTAALCDRLGNYQRNRHKYRAFADFYPELVKVFGELSEGGIGDEFYAFTGEMGGFAQDEKPVVVILPTGETDQTGQKSLHSTTKKLCAKLSAFVAMDVMTDISALKRDLSSNKLILIGTLSGNQWTAHYLSKLPFVIDSNRITAGSTYYGDHVVFATTWPHPENAQKGVLLITGHQLDDLSHFLENFEAVKAQFTDVSINYLIADGTQFLKTGSYKKTGPKWTF